MNQHESACRTDDDNRPLMFQYSKVNLLPANRRAFEVLSHSPRSRPNVIQHPFRQPLSQAGPEFHTMVGRGSRRAHFSVLQGQERSLTPPLNLLLRGAPFSDPARFVCETQILPGQRPALQGAVPKCAQGTTHSNNSHFQCSGMGLAGTVPHHR